MIRGLAWGTWNNDQKMKRAYGRGKLDGGEWKACLSLKSFQNGNFPEGFMFVKWKKEREIGWEGTHT